MKVAGIKETQARIKALTAEYPRAVATALYQEALELYADSILQVPVDTGHLRRSAYAAPPNLKDAQPAARVGYGVSYALPVHDRVEVKHEVGKARFLSDPANARRANYLERLADRVERNVKLKIQIGMVARIAPRKPREGKRPKSRKRRGRKG